MKKYLMRSQMQHDKVLSVDEVFLNNHMGGNCGNWLYQMSIYRALMKDSDVSIDTVNFVGKDITDELIGFVNENYDAFILPLSNAFRDSFIDEMKKLVKFIGRLKIPCIMIGVGIQCKFGKNFIESFEHRDISKQFIKTVLKKSDIIGVRGESTGEFFKSLGFRPEIDYTVIGCPSLYLDGAHLPEPKEFVYADDKLYSYNSKVEQENKKLASLMKGFTREHTDYVYVPQRLTDIIRCYYGIDFRCQYLKGVSQKRFFDDKKAQCFASVREWVDYMRDNVDFSIGTRFHGNVAAILGGVPAFIIANDRRVSELADYHNIAHITTDKITAKTTIRELTEGIDFSSVTKGHAERFNHFVDVLEKNGLDTAYTNNRQARRVYFDDVISSLNFDHDPLPFEAVSSDEKLLRTRNAAVLMANELKAKQDLINELKRPKPFWERVFG